jgi:hypothetical protein
MTETTITIDEAVQIAINHASAGAHTEAVQIFQKVLDADPYHHGAICGLAYNLLHGDDYIANLKKFHTALKPRTYVEIGVETGASIRLAEPPTIAIGIDPNPVIKYSFTAKTQIYSLTSDDFFKQHQLPNILGQDVVDMAFIDGMHLFENVLKDFMNIEKFGGPNTVVLVHDCFPLNALTASRIRQTIFWSGDLWKAMLCLQKYRPDLQCRTIKTAPTGLGVIKGLDPKNTVLWDNWDNIISEYTTMPYDAIAANKEEALNAIENDWQVISKTFNL